ncbi:MAG TPA: peptidyl-prolyl cis-trans isomerase [Polyangiales bacterium]
MVARFPRWSCTFAGSERPGGGLCVRLLLVGSCLVASLPACNRAKDAKGDKPAPTKHGLTDDQAKEPLIVVGDTTVTVGQFAQQLAEKSPYLRARYASPERRRELLDELVKFELLAKEAARRGLDKSEDVQRAKRQVMVQQMMKAEFEDKVKLSDITDAEIEAYYSSHPEEFNKPAQVRASQIVVRDEAKAKRVLKSALEAKDEESFRKLVSEYSEDAETKARGGDLQFFSRPTERAEGDPPVPDAVAEAAFSLENLGDVYGQPVRTPAGFHIVRLTSKRKALARTLDHARRPIQNKLWRQKREEAVDTFIRSLRDKAKVEEHPELLDQLKVDLPDAGSGGAGTPRPTGSPR